MHRKQQMREPATNQYPTGSMGAQPRLHPVPARSSQTGRHRPRPARQGRSGRALSGQLCALSLFDLLPLRKRVTSSPCASPNEFRLLLLRCAGEGALGAVAASQGV